MRSIYRNMERGFETVATVVTALMSNSITFTIAVCMVLFWYSNDQFYTQDIHSTIGDIIFGVTFLSLFVIQRSFSHFSAALHLKVNELVASHEPARNAVLNAEEKTEEEITNLAKEYVELIEEIKQQELPIQN